MRCSAIATKNQKYVLLQLDDIVELLETWGLAIEHPEDRNSIQEFKRRALFTLAPKTSGCIVDPYFSFNLPQAPEQQSALLYRLEDFTVTTNKQLPPALLGNWGVEQIANNLAMAKIELYYHPAEEKALEKKQLLAELQDFCSHEGIDLLLQLRLYKPEGGVLAAEEQQQLQLEAMQELRKSCSLIALEYPGNALAAATLTAELDIPWLLLAHREPSAEPYEQLKTHLREALESGAAGICVGPLLWQEAPFERRADSTIDWQPLEQYLQSTALDRMAELERIVSES